MMSDQRQQLVGSSGAGKITARHLHEVQQPVAADHQAGRLKERFERFAILGPEPKCTSPQKYAAFIKSEIDKLAHIAMAIGLQPV